MRAPVLIAALLAALASAGCGGSDTGEPSAPEPPRSGHFVGTDPDGLGAVVDFGAQDAVLADLRAAATRRPEDAAPVWVGAVALVNRSERSAAVPRFIAVLPGGGAVPLTDPRSALVAIPGAGRIVPAGPLLIAPKGAATVYVALRGAAPGEVEHLRMVVRAGVTVRLAARPR